MITIKNNHSVCKLSYHLVLVCKRRRPFFNSDQTMLIFEQAFDMVAAHHDVTLVEYNCDLDHVHCMFAANISTNLHQFISSLKSCSSRLLKQVQPQFQWSGGTYICTVGSSNERSVRDYITNQRGV